MRAILFSLLTFLLCACNSDIFVEDFTPDVTEITMDGVRSTYTIHFKSDDWSSLTLAGSGYDGSALPTVVTAVGGEPRPGKILEGDGSIALHSWLTDLEVTRRGADVTIDVAYAIGNEPLLLWLEARSDKTYDSHMVTVCINRAGGLEVVGVDYNLYAWSDSPTDAENRLLSAYGCGAESAPVLWTPQLESGLLSFYSITTVTDYEEYLQALTGEKIPVPTRTNIRWADWELRGDMVSIVPYNYNSYTRLQHYPSFPQIAVQPGTVAEFYAEMLPTRFDAHMTVKNKYSGEEIEMIIWVTIEQPEQYFVIRNEI